MVLTLEADDLRLVRWHINASFAVHDDMRGHTGGVMTLGKGGVHNKAQSKKSMARAALKLKSQEWMM